INAHRPARAPECQQIAIPLQQDAVNAFGAPVPLKARSDECFPGARVGRFNVSPVELRKFTGASFAYGLDQFGILVVRKEVEGCGFSILLPHEEQWNAGREEYGRGRKLEPLPVDEKAHAFSSGTVSHLVVVLR